MMALRAICTLGLAALTTAAADIRNELVRAHADLNERRMLEEGLSVEQLQALYSLLDDDGDGALTVHEMIDMFDGVNNDALLIADCAGNPNPHHWLGDGYCDDGSDTDDGGGDFNCNIFSCDDGDCGDTCAVVEGRDQVEVAADMSAVYGNVRESTGEMFEVDLDAGVTYYIYTVIGDSDGHIEDTALQLLDSDGSTVLAANDNSGGGISAHGSYVEFTPDAAIGDATILVLPATRVMRGSFQLYVSTSAPDLSSPPPPPGTCDSIADWQPSPESSDIVGIEAADLSYEAASASGAIILDGDLADWGCAPFLAQTPFRTGNEGSNAPWVEFEEHGGGIHNGIEDQASAWAIAWEAGNLFVGVKAIDDYHQNPGNGWNGDSVQIAFTNEARDAPQSGVYLYNYGLADDGSHTLHHEQHPCPSTDECTEASMQRFPDTTTTIYEIKLPAESLGVDSFTSGYTFGFGICVNDGDTDGSGSGQKGWSGWGPYSIVHGKNSASCGLVTLASPFVAIAASEFTLAGSAQLADNEVLSITQVAGSQQGTAFAPLDVSGADTVNVRYEMYTGDGSGADGLCMNLGAGDMGGRYGEDGVAVGFALCFDEWSNSANHGGHNDEAGDNGDHGVVMFFNGDNMFSDFGECENRQDCTPVSLFEDAQWHSVVVTVTPDGAASFNFDNGLYGGAVQISSYTLPDDVFLGFSGRTGGATNNHWVRAVSVGVGTIAVPQAVASYSFSGNADDSTGTNHGEVTGATLVPDRFGTADEAYFFDGNQVITVATPFTAGESDFSMTVWLSPSVVNDGTWHGFVGYQGDSRSPSLWVNYNGGGQGDGMHWDTRTTQGGDGTRFAGVINSWFTQDVYVHSVWTATAGEMNRFYKDGAVTEDGVVDAAGHVDLHETYTVGKVDNFFHGTIDSVAFYTFALSSSDVAAMYTATSNFGSTATVATYLFAGNADDVTGTNHGSVDGATLTSDRFGTASSAYNFDGNDAITVLTPFTTGSEDFSITIWIAPSVLEDASWHGFSGFQGSARSPSMWVNFNGCDIAVCDAGDGLHWDTRTTQGGDGTRHAGVIDDMFELNTYVHIVWAHTAGDMDTFYKNGATIDDAEANKAAAPHVDLHDTYWIGRVDNFFSGVIDEVSYYTMALSADDAATMYADGAPPAPCSMLQTAVRAECIAHCRTCDVADVNNILGRCLLDDGSAAREGMCPPSTFNLGHVPDSYSGGWVVNGTESCPLAMLLSRFQMVNAACCTDDGCPDGDIPIVCSVDCAATFVPFYLDCGVVLDALFDGTDGEDGEVKEMDGFFDTCIAIPAANVVDAIVALNRSCAVQTAGIIARTADVLAAAESGRRQLQLVYQGMSACSFTTIDARLAAVNTACCSGPRAADICAEAGAAPSACNVECATEWPDFDSECHGVLSMMFPDLLPSFHQLTETCGALPVVPMMLQIVEALRTCQCDPPQSLSISQSLLCSPDSPNGAPESGAGTGWLADPIAEPSCPIVSFQDKLDAVNAACCGGSHDCDDAPPKVCDLDCAIQFVPFYNDCNSTANALFDADDGVQDGIAQQLVGFKHRCLQLNSDVISGRLNEMVLGSCDVDTSGIYAVAESGRRQMQLGTAVDAIVDHQTCSLSEFRMRVDAVDNACCDIEDECNDGQIPQTCDVDCSSTWLELQRDCSDFLQTLFATSPEAVNAFDALTAACNNLPKVPMLTAIHNAECGGSRGGH